ncbi:hypothetical protein BGW36DRAFT_378249 [Talaromyces proteolyticus]|uniref:Uncharacterized protein n=1 Tax=Talaromyces proteolyticus TaxID=1131652 RepID=A0AAD4KQR4_9EURO|nr:uncharacterized protein BGW36DRAFT_378249 [Talaromyces proteolyticus]KAH8697226.1 hypothetical protein BGW36DRAFT_378249 [Talaromyces proteolyticus]
MRQVVDLGISTFKCARLGQCLLSNTTVTVAYQNDTTDAHGLSSKGLDLTTAWVIVERELTVNVRLETNCSLVNSLPVIVKQLVDTLENSLTRVYSYLRVSRRSHEWYTFADNITVQLSMVLNETFGRPRDKLRGRLPRQVRGCTLADPRPPPGIPTYALSSITIHLRSPLHYRPWDIFLTKIWLQDFPKNPLSENNNASYEESSPNGQLIILRPHEMPSNSFPFENTPSQHPQRDSAEFTDQKSVCRVFEENENSLFVKSWKFGSLLDYSIRSLIFGQAEQCLEKIDETRSAECLRISEIAPSILRPGYYDNIRHRAGLVPVIAKSITSMFHKVLSPRSTVKLTSIECRLNVQYGYTTSCANNNFRPMIRRTVWTALQSGVYMTKSVLKPSLTNPATISLADDNMLMEECGTGQGSDDVSLFSSEHMMSDVVDNQAENWNDCVMIPSPQAQGTLISFSEPEINKKWDGESLTSAWETQKSNYAPKYELSGEAEESICWTSQVPDTTSDIMLEHAISSGTSIDEGVTSSFRWDEDCLMDDAVSHSNLCSSLYTTSGDSLYMSTKSTPPTGIADILTSDLAHNPDEEIGDIGNILSI